MAKTKLQVVSMSLQKLGQKPISALNNSSDIEISASAAFDFLLPAIIQRNSWRFAVKQDYLWISNDNPISSYWTYIFDLPSDYLKMIRLYPQSYSWEVYEESKIYANFGGPILSIVGVPITGFDGALDTLTAVNHGLAINAPTIIMFTTNNTLPNTIPVLTTTNFFYARGLDANTFAVYVSAFDAKFDANRFSIGDAGIGASVEGFANNTFIDYVKLPDIDALPDIFASYFVYEIANSLALSNAQYAQYAQVIKDDLAEQRGIAMAWDAMSRPQQGIVSQPIITNRFVSGFLGGPTGGGAGASG